MNKLFATIIITLFISGCSTPKDGIETGFSKCYKIDDKGTECIWCVGGYIGGLSCNWNVTAKK